MIGSWRRRGIHAVVPLLVAAATTGAAPAVAAEWLVRPSVGLEARHVENPRLVVDAEDREAGAGQVLDLATSFERRTERTTLALLPRVRVARFPDVESLDSTDWFVEGRWRSEQERGSRTLVAGFVRDTLLANQLEDVGLVLRNSRHEGRYASAELVHAPSERRSYTLRARWSADDFDAAPSAGLVDYDYASLEGSVLFRRSERLQLGFAATAGRLALATGGADSRDGQVLAIARYALAQNADLELAFGSTTATRAGERTSTGSSYRVDYRYRAPRWDFRLTGSRALAPSGAGGLLRRVDATAVLTGRLHEHVSATFTARQLDSEDPGFGLQRADRVYRRASVALEWRVAEAWSAGLEAGWSDQSFDGDERAVAEAISIGIRYRPLGQRWSS